MTSTLGPPAISATKLHTSFDDRSILRGISLEVHRGQMAIIAGPNGAGKSTLLRALLGLLPLNSGEIWCNNQDLSSLPKSERAAAMAYVPQYSGIRVGLRVDALISHGRFCKRESKRHTENSVASAMERVGIEALHDRNYLELSGGEKRLVLIARALCTGAQIIFLDEPTASLDVANRLRILALLRDLANQGYAIICVLHDLDDVSRFADHVILLDRGQVVRSGASVDVITQRDIRDVYQVELQHDSALGFRLATESGI